MKRHIKIILDITMTIALLFLMAFQVTGVRYHEWLGAGMLVLFVIHNLLNMGWYKAMFKGKYSMQRVLRTVINLAVFVAIVLTGYSGIVMSRYVFAFLPIEGGMGTARKLHLAGSYWAFVLMSIHLGMHWSMIIKKINIKCNVLILWLLRIAACGTAIYGTILFVRAEIIRSMFLLNEFAFFDFEIPSIFVIIQNIAMMTMWIFIGHYLTRALVYFTMGRSNTTKEK